MTSLLLRGLTVAGALTLVAPVAPGQARSEASPRSTAMAVTTANARDVTVRLARQTWFLPGNGSAELTVKLDTTGITAPRSRPKSADRASGPRVQIEIEAHDPIATRADATAFATSVTNSANGDPTTESSETDDDTDADVDDPASLVDRVRVDLRDATMRNRRITVRVVVEPQDDDEGELAMPQQGIHPLVIRVLIDGETVSQIPTFVERLAWGTTEPVVDGVTELAVVGRVDGRPTLRPNGATQTDPAVLDEFDRIRQVLTDLPELPVTLGLRPELIDGLDRSRAVADRTLLDGLAEALGERSLMSQPFVGMDPSAVVAADLGEVYVDELRRGEDVLAESFPRASTLRTVAIVETPLTDAGADVLRDLGVRSVLLLGGAAPTAGTPAATAFDPTSGTDASLASAIPLTSGGALQAHTIDATLAEQLQEAADDPVVFANHMVADLLLWQRELIAAGSSIEGRSLVLTSPDGTLPESATLSALAPLVVRDPRLRFASLDAALGRTDVRTESGDPVTLTTAAAPDTDLSDLAVRLSAANADIATTGSMLPDGDERLARWRGLLVIAPSDALTTEERDEYLATTATETATLRASVVPPPETTFTLGGRSGDVSLSLRNDADVPLTVVVRMASPKLLFPEGPATVELAPESTTIVRIPVEARSNNTFPVTVEVLTPWQLAPVTAPVQLTARVTAFTGLGQVVTGAAVVILASWWVRHWRANRRRRLTAGGSVPTG